MDALVTEVERQANATPLTQQSRREQAIALHRNGHIEHAVEFYKDHLRQHPGDSTIWSNLGACLRSQKHFQSALACYQRALESAPGNRAALGNLGNVLKDMHRLEQSIETHQALVSMQPDCVQSRINLAAALREDRQFEAALWELEKAQSLESTNAGVRWERGQALLHLGRYAEGFEAYEARWQTGDLPVPRFNCPQWRAENLEGKRIVVHAEQGYGDTLFALRYLSRFQDLGAYVVLQCKRELHRLLRDLPVNRLACPGEHVGTLDYHCPLMSLPGLFATEADTVPPPVQLEPTEAAREKFLDLHLEHRGQLKVGIVWSGSVTFKNNANRAVPMEYFAPLAEIDGLKLYSLQKGPRLRELYEQGADAYIVDLGSRCLDFADTAAAIEQLDVIVMTDSCIAHLAGSMGIPVINLLQYVPYWIYSLEDATTPWYPTHQLVKQQTAGEWGPVFARAGELLQEMVSRSNNQRE